MIIRKKHEESNDAVDQAARSADEAILIAATVGAALMALVNLMGRSRDS